MSKEQPSRTVLSNARNLEAIIRKGMSDGLTMEQLANECQASAQSLRKYMKILGINYRRHKTRIPPGKVIEFMELRKRGCTLKEIGRMYGITRERVRQTLAKYYPDIVLPSHGRKVKVCPLCKTTHNRSVSGGYCSIECKRAGTGKWVITRDTVERIMQLRDYKATWNEVAHEIGYSDNGQVLRAQLQREKRLFSTKEQKTYLPLRDDKNEEQETEHADPKPVLQMLGKFLRLT